MTSTGEVVQPADQGAHPASSRLARIRRGLTPAEWARFGGMVATVVGLNVLGWGMLAAALGGHYQIGKTTVFGVGTGALAYTLGMRHAFDADHIAAIGPYLPTHWWLSFDSILRAPVDTSTLLKGLLSFGVYAVLFCSFAWARFTSADVTS